jgi:hypothetical protein
VTHIYHQAFGGIFIIRSSSLLGNMAEERDRPGHSPTLHRLLLSHASPFAVSMAEPGRVGVGRAGVAVLCPPGHGQGGQRPRGH